MAVPDIFDEVAEDLRAERTHKLLRRYGGVLVMAAVLVVVAAAGYEGWKQYQGRETTRQATAFLAAEQLADGPKSERDAALPALADLAQNGNAGYRTLARMREASLKVDDNDLPTALALWDQIAGDRGADPILRDYANLQWAMHQLDHGDAALVSARLLPLSAPGSVWRTLAQEGQALLALRQGQTESAREILQHLAADTLAPNGVRNRAAGLLQRLGS
jgi:hypothetical protein